MKIAVTGGTGFIGRNLVARLVGDGHQLTVLARHTILPKASFDSVDFVEGSVTQPETLPAALNGADIVYHLVGIIAETATNTFQKTIVGGTENVVETCLAAGVRRIIYLSAMGVTANAVTNYHKTKYCAEQTVINSGLEHVIFRPSVVYGEGDGFVSMLRRMIRVSPVTPVVGTGRYPLQPVYIDDLIEAMAGALTVETARNKIIEIGGPEKLEYMEILNIIKRVLGKSRMNIRIPIGVMRLIAGLLEKVMTPAPLTRDQLAMMEMGNTGDISDMKKLFSIDPIKFEDGLRKYLR